MGRQKANTAIVDIDFLIGGHHKLAGLSEVDRCRYLALWGLATKLGREHLPEAYNLTNDRLLKRAINAEKGRSLQSSCIVMEQNGLILTVTMHDLRTIVVVGLADRAVSRTIRKYKGTSGLVWFGLDCKTKTKTSAVPKTAGNVDNAEKPKKAQITQEPKPPPAKAERSLAQRANDEDMEEIITDWVHRFPDS